MSDKAKRGSVEAKPESVELDEFKKSFDKRDKKYPSLEELRPIKKQLKQGPLDSRRDQSKKKQNNIFLLKGVQEGPAKRFTTLKKVSLDMPKIMLSDGTEFKAKGGRAGYKSGMRVCKLAVKGKGRAYGKNS
jgi:hypothetical protein